MTDHAQDGPEASTEHRHAHRCQPELRTSPTRSMRRHRLAADRRTPRTTVDRDDHRRQPHEPSPRYAPARPASDAAPAWWHPIASQGYYPPRAPRPPARISRFARRPHPASQRSTPTGVADHHEADLASIPADAAVAHRESRSRAPARRGHPRHRRANDGPTFHPPLQQQHRTVDTPSSAARQPRRSPSNHAPAIGRARPSTCRWGRI